MDFDQKQKEMEKDIDELVKNLQRELDTIKQSLTATMNKKADYPALDQVKEQLIKKVDHEYFQQVANKIKQDCLA